MTLFIAGPEDAGRIETYNRLNEQHLRPWNPPMGPSRFDAAAIARARCLAVEDAVAGRGFSFALTKREEGVDAPLIGWANLSKIVRGAFQAAYLGYELAETMQGNGYMTEALEAIVDFAFGTLQLHRIMANYMPFNERSAAVLRRLHFEIEGTARSYLYIENAWKDHVLTSRVNPNGPVPAFD